MASPTVQQPLKLELEELNLLVHTLRLMIEGRKSLGDAIAVASIITGASEFAQVNASGRILAVVENPFNATVREVLQAIDAAVSVLLEKTL